MCLLYVCSAHQMPPRAVVLLKMTCWKTLSARYIKAYNPFYALVFLKSMTRKSY